MRVNKYVDSTIIDRNHTERQRADTLVIHDSVFVRTYRYLSEHDTIRIVERDSVPYPVEVAIEVDKPVPRFYRNSTLAFWLLLLALLAHLALRALRALRAYLHR